MTIINRTPIKTVFPKLMLLATLVCCQLAFFPQPAIAALSDFQDRLDRVTDKQTNLSQDSRLAELMDVIYDYHLDEYPEYGTYLGDSSQDHRWTDMSAAAIEQRKNETMLLLEALESLDVLALGADARLDYKLVHKDLSFDVEAQDYSDDLMPLNQMGGIQQSVARMISMMPARNVGQYRNIVARLESADTLIEQNITLLKRGLGKGLTPPAITLRDVPQQVRNQLFDDPMDSSLLASFKHFPDSIDGPQQAQLKAAAIAAYKTKIAPAYSKLLRFLEQHYLPNAVKEVGLASLPQGREWYAHRVQRLTTTEFTPQQIHQLGLSEVKRIREAMDRVIASSGFEGDFNQFTEFLRTDPQFYFTSKEDLLREYRNIAKKADAQLPALFGKLPRLPYGVKAIPAYAEKSQTTAYYSPGAQSVGRAGIFFANTYALHTRPIWEMEALTVHEAMPGHHLQIALAQEQTNLHRWRRDMYSVTAFVEGWGLYSESLGDEMGFYKDPYSKFGQLTYEMWRAVRLVVDTGMHSLGWSRQRAIDFFIANSAKSEHDITVEIDRYIVWPGQALAYKMGELKIKELRAYATAELGDDFDIRSFHDFVLEAGPIPLDILEMRVRGWVEGSR
ncbi:MAG: DUF885 domain-containing protein [Porticoccaceae bacterium]|nr:DUF885 domain-containing protein [Porticoccaceae bacterium]